MLPKALVAVALVAVLVGVFVERSLTAGSVRTIAEARSLAREEGTIVLQGDVVYAEQNHFVIRDETGTAELVTCPTWYKRICLREGEQVRVVGQLMASPITSAKASVVVKVYRIHRGREVIVVQGSPGKPPWMRGPMQGE